MFDVLQPLHLHCTWYRILGEHIRHRGVNQSLMCDLSQLLQQGLDSHSEHVSRFQLCAACRACRTLLGHPRRPQPLKVALHADTRVTPP